MNKKQGVSIRRYAELAGCSHPYVLKLISKGAIRPNADGSLDPRTCDAQRALATRRRRSGDTPSNGIAVCVGCSDRYRWAPGSPDPEKFCSMECCREVAAGKTIRQIRRAIAREANAQ